MRHTSRVVGAALTVAVLSTPALPAAAFATTVPTGVIEICNKTGYMFDVYADGPSVRTDDLAGYLQQCTSWTPVLTGRYDIGFALRVPSRQRVIFQVRIKRDRHTFYKVFGGHGVFSTNVAKDEKTRVDMFMRPRF